MCEKDRRRFYVFLCFFQSQKVGDLFIESDKSSPKHGSHFTASNQSVQFHTGMVYPHPSRLRRMEPGRLFR